MKKTNITYLTQFKGWRMILVPGESTMVVSALPDYLLTSYVKQTSIFKRCGLQMTPI